MKLILILFVNFGFIFIGEAGLIKELIETVKEDVRGVKSSLHNTFSKDPAQNENKEKQGILTNIVDSVGYKLNKAHDVIHDTVHNILPFEKYKNKGNGDKIDTTPGNVHLKPENNVYPEPTTEKLVNNNMNQQDYSSLIDVRSMNVSQEPKPTEQKEISNQNNFNSNYHDEVDLSSEAEEKTRNELTESISNNSINKNIRDTRDSLIFYDQNKTPALKVENKIDENLGDNNVVFPGMSNKHEKNFKDSYNNNDSIHNSKITQHKNCAEGLVKAADGSCKKPVVIDMNKTAVNVTLTGRDNFVGSCLPGTGRALDGSCQDSID